MSKQVGILRVLRQNQQKLMVVFGVLLMFAFILGGVISSGNIFNPSPVEDNRHKVAVSWSEGTITEEDLGTFRTRHYLTERFVAMLQQKAFEKNITPKSRVGLMGLANGSYEDELRSAFYIKLRAQEAKELGILFDDTAVIDYLRRQTDYQISDEKELRALLSETTQNQLAWPRLLDQLKIELAASTYNMISNVSPMITPTYSLDAELRNTRRARIQIVKVPILDYVEKVTGEPSASEMKELFARGAIAPRNPASGVPGFRRANQAKLEWVAVKPGKFRPAETTISDEQVQAEYDRLVKEKHSSILDFSANLSPLPGTAPAVPPTETKPMENAPPATPMEATPAPTEPAKAAEENKTPAEGTPEKAPEATPAPAEPAKTDGEAPKNSGLKTTADLQFVNVVVPQDPAPATPAQTEPAPAAPAQTTPAPVETPKTETPAPGQTPAEPAATPATTEPAAGTPAVQPPAVQPPAEPTPVKSEPKIKPLDDLMKKEIRDRLLSDIDRQKSQEAITKFQDVLNKVREEYENWEAEKDENPDAPAPKLTDLKAEAEKLGLEFSRLDKFSDHLTFVRTDAGRSSSMDPAAFQAFIQSGVQLNLADLLFGEFSGTLPYIAKEGRQFDESGAVTYLVWVTEKRNEANVTFDEAKEDIVEYWKYQKAVDLAKEAAASMAKQSEGKKLAEVFADKVMNSEQFSWFSAPMSMPFNQNSGPTISSIFVTLPSGKVDTLSRLGNDFMRDVFKLKANEVAVTTDEARENVYVVQMIETTEIDAVVAQGAVANQQTVSPTAGQIANIDVTSTDTSKWLEQMEKKWKVRWSVK